MLRKISIFSFLWGVGFLSYLFINQEIPMVTDWPKHDRIILLIVFLVTMVWLLPENKTKSKVTKNNELTEKEMTNICFSYRHDYGLLDKEERDEIRFQAKQWYLAMKNNKIF